MDALIYTVMSGAERAMRAQQVHANNLANLDTPGFRADFELATQQTVQGHGYDARHLNQLHTQAFNAKPGAMRETGRELDVAIQGPGYFAVQWEEGEAYTRAGGMTLGLDGALLVNGRPVLGEGGPIELPPFTRIAISNDGVISIQAQGQQEMQEVDRLKLVNPLASNVIKNEAGLIMTRDGTALATDDTVRIRAGHLEGSNVSAIEELVAAMSVNRDFEIQMKLFKAADSMTESGNRLIRE